MKDNHKNYSQSFEGFETWWNEFQMTFKMHRKIILILICLHLLISSLAIFIFIEPKVLDSTMQWVLAYFLWPTAHLTFRNPDGTIAHTTAGYIVQIPALKAVSIETLFRIRKVFLWCSLVYSLYPGFVILFKQRSTSQATKKHIRGTRLIDIDEYKRDALKRNEDLDLPLGEAKMPVSAEPRHLFIVGQPGTGKTVCISQIIERLKDREEKGIILDFKGDYLSKFYNPETDLIFNPLDIRSLKWNLFNEIETYMDVDAISASLIPYSISNQDPFWPDAARDVLAGILHYLYRHDRHTNKDIWSMLTADGPEIAARLKSTPEGHRGFRYIEDASSKQAMGVFSTLMQYAKCMEYMALNDGPFSISNWLSHKKGMIFITNYASVKDTLRPILSLFVDLLGRRLLSLPDSYERRVFMILDEFGSLQRLSSIISLLTTSRSKGGSILISIQDYGQLDKLYSKEHTQSILNSCGNFIVFAVDEQTAEISSKKIGESEFMEVERTRSMGVADYRDGTSLSERKKKEYLFLPSDIMSLPDLTAIVRIKGYHPFVTRFNYKKYPDLFEWFKMRPEFRMKAVLPEEISQNHDDCHGGALNVEK